VAGWLSDRIGTRPLTALGLGMLVVAYGLLSTLAANTGTLGYISRIVWVGLGMGIFQSPNNSAIMGSVPRERLGVASGLLSLTRTLGQTMGVALIGASWAALVHRFDATRTVSATVAPVGAQLMALRWVARGISLLLCAALALALVSWQGVQRRTPRPGPKEG